jgi:uncharacterized protein YidB (DUF937 family)
MVSQQQIMQLLQNPQVQSLVQNLLKQVTGGKAPDMSQLISTLTSSGLGGQAASWVGTGENQPITGDQLQQALGSDTIGQLAQQSGLAPNEAANDLASVLPGLVDQLTPNGQVPDAQSLQSQLSQLMGQMQK